MLRVSEMPVPSQILSLLVTGPSLELLYQHSQELFSESAVEAKSSAIERHLKAYIGDFKYIRKTFWQLI